MRIGLFPGVSRCWDIEVFKGGEDGAEASTAVKDYGIGLPLFILLYFFSVSSITRGMLK